jgi:hypothetical protein
MHDRTAWEDYFIGTPTNFSSQTCSKQQTLSGTSVYLSNCLFVSITTESAGGALYCTSAAYFLVESTSFFSCKTTTQYGGAIYFDNKMSGQCALHDVCGYDCYSTQTSISDGQFAVMCVYNVAYCKNYVNYSSIVRCVNDPVNSRYVLFLSQGKICCTSANMSMNKCYYRTFYCEPLKDSTSHTCSITYSSFADNTAYGYTCLFLWTNGGNFEIKSCNVLRNTQGTLDSEGTIQTIGNLKIEDSCILENEATYIFRQYTSSCMITLWSCTVDKTTCNQNLIIQITVTKSFIHALNHMSTLNCHAEYDAAGTLTPISPPPSKKQIHCYTCGKIFNQTPLIDLVSLLCVLIFNFIIMDASSDYLY